MCLKADKLFGVSCSLNMLIVGVYEENSITLLLPGFLCVTFYCLQIVLFSAFLIILPKLGEHILSQNSKNHIIMNSHCLPLRF